MAKASAKLFTEEAKNPMKDGDMNAPEEKAEEPVAVKEEAPKKKAEQEVKEELPAPVKKDDDIQDIDLSVIAKKRFRIDGDNNKIIELDTSDLGIVTRLRTAYDKLNELMDEVGKQLQKLPDSESEADEEYFNKLAETLSSLDTQMREQVDFIFDAPVSEKCAGNVNLWTPKDGAFVYEHIIDRLVGLYEHDLAYEFFKMKQRVSDRTAKYTKAKTAMSKYHN